MIRTLTLCLILALAPALAPHDAAARTLIKLGTVAPEGSVWHDALMEVRQEWRRLSGGEVELRIYAGGVLGGEEELVRKMQRRGLDAAAITGAGLPRIDRSVDVLNIPMLFESYEELDYVRSRISPQIEARLAAHNYKVLTWADAGWVYFFSRQPIRTPDDLRTLRLWVSAGEPRAEKLYKDFGFQVVPLPVTDMLTALQTGLVEVIDVPPLYALLDRSYQIAHYMPDVRWAPLNAALIITTSAWERIPPALHEDMAEAVRRIVGAIKDKIRTDGEQAIIEMETRGLEVLSLRADERELWRQEARKAYPTLRDNTGLPEIFNEVLRLADEYKALNQAGIAADPQPGQ